MCLLRYILMSGTVLMLLLSYHAVVSCRQEMNQAISFLWNGVLGNLYQVGIWLCMLHEHKQEWQRSWLLSVWKRYIAHMKSYDLHWGYMERVLLYGMELSVLFFKKLCPSTTCVVIFYNIVTTQESQVWLVNSSGGWHRACTVISH